MRNLLLLSCASLALVVGMSPADAANLRMRGASSGPTAPILNNVTFPIGQYTANGYGSARLSSQDDLTSYAVPVYGLGLMSPLGTACANWTTTQTGGTATHFSKYTGAEGTTARTPTISSAGDSNNLASGPYTFSVSCTDANGAVSNTATLTYQVVANAANVDEFLGNFPAVTSGFSTFANTAGYKLLLPLGFKKLTSLAPSIQCPTECALEWAVPAKPGLLQSFSINQGGNTKIHINGIIATGNSSAHPWSLAVRPTVTTNTLRMTNSGCKFKPEQAMQNPLTCLNTSWNGAPGDSITGFLSDWVAFGININAPGYTIKNSVVRNYATNAFNVGNADDLTVEDLLMYNPQVAVGGYHADCLQISNGATIKNWNWNRTTCLTAGGHGPTQGMMFPGHTTVGKGYIDDGAGGAGLNVKIVPIPPLVVPKDPNSFFAEGAAGSQFFTKDGCITAGENARLASSNGYDAAVLTGISARVCGSSAAPIDIAAYTGENVNFKNIANTGYSPWGMATHQDHGTGGMQNFVYLSQVPLTQYATSVVVNIVGNQMTTVGPTSSNAVYNAGLEYGAPGTGYGFNYPGLTGGTLFLNAKSAGSRYCLGDNGGCVYTLNRAPGDVSGVTISAVPPVGVPPLNQHMPIKQLDADLAWLHTGTGTTYKDGFTSSGMQWPMSNGSSYQAFPPANTTLTNFYSTTTATPATSFVDGDPTTILQAVTQATWDAASPAEVLRINACAMSPKVGGTLDNGDGTFASPFKRVGSQVQWSDGTVIGNC